MISRKRILLKSQKNKCFSDIDYFEMTGIGIQDEGKLKYPCFQIDSVNENQKNITYLVSSQNKFSRQYFRKNTYWFSSYMGQGDTSTLTTYNYIFDNKKILWLEYANDINHNPINMYSFSIFENNIESTYSFEEPLKISPTTEVEQLLKNRIAYKIISNYSINDGVLKVVTENINLLNKTTSKDSNIYNIGNHSIFWWYHFR